jgi:hypothetical protein
MSACYDGGGGGGDDYDDDEEEEEDHVFPTRHVRKVNSALCVKLVIFFTIVCDRYYFHHYFKSGSAGGILVITYSFMIIVRTLPVKSKYLMSNTFLNEY